jgi:gamma-glutamyltranspeptidase/glutathione hydrolase
MENAMSRPERRMLEARAMIVAPQPEAVEVGAQTLADGGNAIDAIVACALTQGVVDPLMCGIGGVGCLQVFDPASGTKYVLDGLSTCPSACHEDMWADKFEHECADGFGYVVRGQVNELGHRSVTPPGILRVLEIAHARSGRTPWLDLFAAAIAVAEDGFVVRPHVATLFGQTERVHGRLPYGDKLRFGEDARRIYLRPDGTPKRAGDRIVNPDLASTLSTIARAGAEDFYTGEIAERIINDMKQNDGLLSTADLATCTPFSAEPMSVTYRGFTVDLPPPPAGGIMVAEMLRILERFDLVALGHNTPAYIKVVAEAMKIPGRDKERHIGDPRILPPPIDLLLSDSYANECAITIRSGRKVPLSRAVTDGQHTTTVSCVDRDGMVATLTHTLGLPSGVIPPGTGFMLNGAMNWYDPRPGRSGSIAAGKRRFSSMSPTIVHSGGSAVATVGAPGGAWIPIAILQVLVNILDFGMGIQEAVMAPRFSATSDVIDISNRIERRTEKELGASGYRVRRSPLSYAFAGVHGITMFDGLLEGGADPQRDGYAAGVV